VLFIRHARRAAHACAPGQAEFRLTQDITDSPAGEAVKRNQKSLSRTCMMMH